MPRPHRPRCPSARAHRQKTTSSPMRTCIPSRPPPPPALACSALHLRLGPRPLRGTTKSTPCPPLSASGSSKGPTSGGGAQGPRTLPMPPGVSNNSCASRRVGAAPARPQPKRWTPAQLAAHLGSAVSSEGGGEWAARRSVGGRAYHAHVGGGDGGDGSPSASPPTSRFPSTPASHCGLASASPPHPAPLLWVAPVASSAPAFPCCPRSRRIPLASCRASSLAPSLHLHSHSFSFARPPPLFVHAPIHCPSLRTPQLDSSPSPSLSHREYAAAFPSSAHALILPCRVLSLSLPILRVSSVYPSTVYHNPPPLSSFLAGRAASLRAPIPTAPRSQCDSPILLYFRSLALPIHSTHPSILHLLTFTTHKILACTLHVAHPSLSLPLLLSVSSILALPHLRRSSLIPHPSASIFRRHTPPHP
ncbi:hypothetical protein DFH09DRAFT_1375516 [Mycena vulgaris]|nr:hypothetical protein DFH09DRAFT_1375516 [Mycena vulgaris]